MREMKDSKVGWLGPIPRSWKLDNIKYQLKERIENNIPIKTRDILSLTAKQGVIPLSEKEGGGNKPKEDFTQYRLAYPGDIVMNSMNILSGSVGLSRYFGCVSPVYYMLRPYNNDSDVRFYNYIFQTSVFQKSLFGLGNGILIKESGNGKLNTIRMRIPMDKFGRLLIPVAPYKEQKAIADFLDKKCSEIDALTKDIEKQIDVLADYKKSVITEAVTKGLNPNVEMKVTSQKWIPYIPCHWELNKGKYYFETRNTKGNSINLEILSPTQKFGVIPQKLYEELTSMVTVKVNLTTNLMSFKTIHKGDYCISLRSFEGGFEYCNYEGVVSPAYTVFYPIVDVDKRFYKYLFKINTFISEMNSHSLSLRDGKPISFDDFGNTFIPYPSKTEQKAIADYLDDKCGEIDGTISDKEKQLEILAEYKKSLIYEYVTGKKEVNV